MFYEEIKSMAMKLHATPSIIKDIVYDPRFNSSAILDELLNDEDVDEYADPDRYYYPLISDIKVMLDFGTLQYVCNSTEMNEEYECGDYDYYCGFLNPECPIIYHDPSHSWAFPARIIFHAPQFQIEVSSDTQCVHIYESVKTTRNILYMEPIELRLSAVKNMLANSDRPRLDI